MHFYLLSVLIVVSFFSCFLYCHGKHRIKCMSLTGKTDLHFLVYEFTYRNWAKFRILFTDAIP